MLARPLPDDHVQSSDRPTPQNGAAHPPTGEVVVVGRVGRAHGLDGSFVVEGASDVPDRFAVGARLLVDGEEAEVVSAKRAGGRPVIRLDRRVRRGAGLGIPRAELPTLEPDAYYVFELVGLAVQDEDGRLLGRVVAVESPPANDVLELDSGLSLPLVEACVREVDLEKGRIVISPGYADSVE
jgi:16S rRNA processing protein RimM